jgi:hypothetical protein
MYCTGFRNLAGSCTVAAMDAQVWSAELCATPSKWAYTPASSVLLGQQRSQGSVACCQRWHLQQAFVCCALLLSQVLAIDKRRASDEVIIYVWDATDAKPACAR